MKPGMLLDVPDLVEHPEHRLVGAAVQRTVERRRRASHRRIRIDVRAADAAHRVGAAVLLVVRVQDEQTSSARSRTGFDLVLQLRHPEQHVQEVAREAEVVVRLVVGTADAVPVGVRRDGRNLGDQAVNLLLSRLLVEDLLAVGVERRECANGAQVDAHRMRVVLEPFHQLLDVLVKHGVGGDLPLPLVELRLPVGSSPKMIRYAVSRYVECSASCSIG